MARLARLVIRGFPERGNRRERVFFEGDDCRAYLALIAAAASKSGAEIWACCVLPNPVHIIMAPAIEDGSRRPFAEARRRDTGRVNAPFQQTEHLWQGRFSGVVMDERRFSPPPAMCR